MKKFLKVFFSILGLVLLATVLFIAGFWLKYRSIVDVSTQKIPKGISSAYPLSSQVNPFIGTGGVPWTCANNFPGVSLPFGVVRLSPETSSFLTNDKALNTSGYFYGNNKIIGFSHTRLVGTGATDGGHFLVMPVHGNKLGKGQLKDMSYHFSHKDEMAYPGYYSVGLPEQRIKVELTGTERVGIHRYTFANDTNPGILLDITHAVGDKRSEEGYIKINSETQEVEGHVRTFGSFGGRFGGLKVYFAARFSTPFASYGVWKNSNYSMNSTSVSGDQISAEFTFDLENDQNSIELKLAISHVSIENAWENLEAETSDKPFDQIAEEALHAWENRLSSINITSGSAEQRINFYTALYRCFQMPTAFSDVNGDYTGFDKKVHQADSFTYFTDMSIWDTFRTVHPLFNMIALDDQRNMIVSLIQMAKEGGWLPRWPSRYGYTGSMLGSASDIVISEAWQKGIRNYDVEFAYQNMKMIALASTPPGSAYSGRRGNDDCVKYGFCPADSMKQAVSRTLEYAWSDYSIGLLAKELGYDEDARLFHEYSMNYKNVWNPETQYFHPRNANGKFVEDFDPLLLTYLSGDDSFTNDYVEGSALQWRWAPLFDAKGLIGLFKNKEFFISELDTFFEKSEPERGNWNPGSYYWHGNEPDIHAAYLFNYAGRPDLTQRWVRWILNARYANRYDGLDGNDDAGTLSAWYIFSALGFYPVAGTDIYQLGAPLFEKAEINMGEVNLSVVAENYAPDHIYVKNIWLNDSLLDRTWFKHHEIQNGGTLIFEMSKEPTMEK
ncbi:MAG: GH92 family glycosyl hydrolase [Cyclobacteriaceae bacterium]|nr:GH92 family glycosyl hydrolase [Cyclobacteriaceae bacterium]